MKNKAIIVGAFHEIIELCQISKVEIIGIIDILHKHSFMDYKILGDDNAACDLFKQFKDIPLIISPDQPTKRKDLVGFYHSIGYKFINLISPYALISKSAQLRNGLVIQSRVDVSASAIIGDFAKINSGASIMHDCEIGDYTSIAPHAVVLGNVKIGHRCYIGANATILPHIKIGNDVIIGAGTVVTKNIPDGKVMVGNPAKEIIKKTN